MSLMTKSHSSLLRLTHLIASQKLLTLKYLMLAEAAPYQDSKSVFGESI